jgi:lipopolysaccharide transport system ATP-binding protein
MYVRLALRRGGFLEPEILIVDEEFTAVGDASFQKKAIGKMQDISMKEAGLCCLWVIIWQ